jgi:hypothetical protein
MGIRLSRRSILTYWLGTAVVIIVGLAGWFLYEDLRFGSVATSPPVEDIEQLMGLTESEVAARCEELGYRHSKAFNFSSVSIDADPGVWVVTVRYDKNDLSYDYWVLYQNLDSMFFQSKMIIHSRPPS